MLTKITEFISLDDLLYATYSEIINNGINNEGKRGSIKEIINFSATLINPLARTSMSLNRKGVQSKFGDFAWYLSREDNIEFIKPYIALYEKEEQIDNKVIGGYGSKIFGWKNSSKSQYERVIEQLNKRKSTKQAFIVISDILDYRYRDGIYDSPPCTIGLHFHVSRSRLNLTCYMRSNDAVYGLTHDLFCFTLLQEMVSLRTNIPIGNYTHVSTPMHVYEKHLSLIKNYLREGKQEPVVMPKIKECSDETLDSVSKEFDIHNFESNITYLDDYWKDFTLFSKKYFNETVNYEEWISKFTIKEMKTIASNSVS